MKGEDIEILDFAFKKRIKGEFGLKDGGEDLMQSCRFGSGRPSIDLEWASSFMTKCLWKRLQSTRVLKVVI